MVSLLTILASDSPVGFAPMADASVARRIPYCPRFMRSAAVDTGQFLVEIGT